MINSCNPHWSDDRAMGSRRREKGEESLYLADNIAGAVFMGELKT